MEHIRLPHDVIELRSDGCTFRLERRAPAVLWLQVRGVDHGQFGDAVLRELALAMQLHDNLELFIETDDSVSVTVPVSDQWTRFLAANKARLRRVSVLAGSRLMHLTVAIAQHRAEMGRLVQIYSDAALFDDMLARASA